MVHLIFKGSRRDYLTTQRPAYEQAVADGTVNDFLDIVYGRYARRYPIELEMTDEPSPEFLAAVDDEAPDPEREPLSDDLSDDERAVEEKKIKERQALIQKRRKVRGCLILQTTTLMANNGTRSVLVLASRRMVQL